MSDTLKLNGKEYTITPGQVETPKKTYFYEQPNGKVVAADTVEDAWQMHKKFKQIGVSDGMRYFNAVMEAHELLNSQGFKASQDRLRLGFTEELEAARGHFETPPNPNYMGQAEAIAMIK